MQFICKMNTNHRITGSNSSLTLSGDNTKTLCWASKDISNYNQWCILSEKPFLMGLFLLLLKARPVFPQSAGNMVNLFVLTLLPAPLSIPGRPGSVPRGCPGSGFNIIRQMSFCLPLVPAASLGQETSRHLVWE